MKVEGEKVTEISRKELFVSIPSSATQIGQLACFRGLVTSLNFNNANITIIGKYAFSYCNNLKEFVFPSSLKEICEGAFQHCIKFKRLIFGDDSKLQKIGKKAFISCYNLESVKFPPLIEYIGDYAFESHEKMIIFDLRNTKLRHIGVLNMLKSNIMLPSTVSSYSLSQLYGNFIEEISFDPRHPIIRIDEGGLVVSGSTIIKVIKKHLNNHIRIRRGIEVIGQSSFDVSYLVSITIPASVKKISKFAFYASGLERLIFAKNSQLEEIELGAFRENDVKNIKFPSSLRIIRKRAFDECSGLCVITFPIDSKLEIIEDAFGMTGIKDLDLPASVKSIEGVCFRMEKLSSIHVKNELFESDINRKMITSKDGSELYGVAGSFELSEIPESIKVIKKKSLSSSSIPDELIIPSNVEVIEDRFCDDRAEFKKLIFEEGSQLKSLGFHRLATFNSITINNEHFTTRENGVVVSNNPIGIVFVPKDLVELDIDFDVEIVYSKAFNGCKIERLSFPKSLKKIYDFAFSDSCLESITFEEGTELDFIKKYAFNNTKLEHLKLPLIKGKLGCLAYDYFSRLNSVEFPPNFNPTDMNHDFIYNVESLEKIICPKSSLPAVVSLFYDSDVKFEIIEG